MSTPALPAIPSPRRDKPVNRWHRNAGVAAAGMLVYLLVTGVPLQFSALLNLGQHHVNTPWILDWYGLQAPELVVQSGQVVQVGQWLFVGAHAYALASPLVGAISIHDVTIVAGRHDLLMLSGDAGQMPEITPMSVAIERIGLSGETPYLDTDSGLLVADALLLNWHSSSEPPGEIQWADLSALPAATATGYRDRFRMRMLTMERWLQDLHSGRFFGSIGVVIVDLAAALLLLLAGTGLALWWRYRRS